MKHLPQITVQSIVGRSEVCNGRGEVREFNIVYLVDDEYLKDSDLYVYINNYGVSYGQDLDNKKLVSLIGKG